MKTNQETKKIGHWSIHFSKLAKAGRIEKRQMSGQVSPGSERRTAEGVALVNESRIF